MLWTILAIAQIPFTLALLWVIIQIIASDKGWF